MVTRGLSRLSKAPRWDSDKREVRGNPSRNDKRELVEATSSRKGLAGVIFMCNNHTKQECFRYKVFGLPLARRDLVEQVTPGTLLFLFNFDTRELYGIYEAISHGGMDLEPNAFRNFQGSYPAQVRFDTYRECLPLPEDIFKDAIKENYYARNKFSAELTAAQVSKLVQLFCPIEPPRKRIDPGLVSDRRYQEEQLRLGLLERREAGYRDSHRLISEASRVERLPGLSAFSVDRAGHASLLPRKRPYQPDIVERVPIGALERQEPRPRLVEGGGQIHLPQIRTLQGRANPTGLLEQGRIDEVDQLALKYLQRADPRVTESALKSLDQYKREAVVPQGGGPLRIGHAPILAQHGPEMGADRIPFPLRGDNVAGLVPGLRSSAITPPLALPHGRRVPAYGSLRQASAARRRA